MHPVIQDVTFFLRNPPKGEAHHLATMWEMLPTHRILWIDYVKIERKTEALTTNGHSIVCSAWYILRVTIVLLVLPKKICKYVYQSLIDKSFKFEDNLNFLRHLFLAVMYPA